LVFVVHASADLFRLWLPAHNATIQCRQNLAVESVVQIRGIRLSLGKDLPSFRIPAQLVRIEDRKA
jgi:hypothetical protein